MTYRIHLNDITVAVETEDELRVAIRVIRESVQLPLFQQAQVIGAGNHNANGAAVADRANPYSLFWHRATKPSIRTMLVLLAENQTGLTDQELRARLSLESNRQLSGITSGITKNAKAVGLDFQNIITKHSSVVNGNRVYRYVVVPVMRDFLQTVNRPG